MTQPLLLTIEVVCKSVCMHDTHSDVREQYLCQSSTKQVQKQNSAGADDPYSLSCIEKETVEMELRAFKLTMNFRKTLSCERKGHQELRPCLQ